MSANPQIQAIPVSAADPRRQIQKFILDQQPYLDRFAESGARYFALLVERERAREAGNDASSSNFGASLVASDHSHSANQMTSTSSNKDESLHPHTSVSQRTGRTRSSGMAARMRGKENLAEKVEIANSSPLRVELKLASQAKKAKETIKEGIKEVEGDSIDRIQAGDAATAKKCLQKVEQNARPQEKTETTSKPLDEIKPSNAASGIINRKRKATPADDEEVVDVEVHEPDVKKDDRRKKAKKVDTKPSDDVEENPIVEMAQLLAQRRNRRREKASILKPHKEEPPKKGPANKVVPDPSDSERVEETEAEGIQVAPKTKAKSKRKTILTSLEEEVKRQGKKGSGKNLGLRMAATFKADGLGGENGRMTLKPQPRGLYKKAIGSTKIAMGAVRNTRSSKHTKRKQPSETKAQSEEEDTSSDDLASDRSSLRVMARVRPKSKPDPKSKKTGVNAKQSTEANAAPEPITIKKKKKDLKTIKSRPPASSDAISWSESGLGKPSEQEAPHAVVDEPRVRRIATPPLQYQAFNVGDDQEQRPIGDQIQTRSSHWPSLTAVDGQNYQFQRIHRPGPSTFFRAPIKQALSRLELEFASASFQHDLVRLPEQYWENMQRHAMENDANDSFDDPTPLEVEEEQPLDMFGTCFSAANKQLWVGKGQRR